MTININIIDLLIIVGSLLSIILGFYSSIKGGCRNHKFLALFLLILGIQLFLSSSTGLSLLKLYPYSVILIDSIPFLLSISMYFYIYHSFYREYNPGLNPIFHFIVPLINSCMFIVLSVLWSREKFSSVVNLVITGEPPLFIIVTTFIKIIFGLLYSFLIFRVIKEFKSNLKLWLQNKERRIWFLTLIISFVLVWLSILLLAIITNTDMGISLDSLVLIQITLFITFIIIITIFSIKYPLIFSKYLVREKIKQQLKLSNTDVNNLKKEIDNLIREKTLFLDPDLSLTKVAKLSGLHNNQLSFIINEKSIGNFSNYINSFRVEKFKFLVRTMDPKVDTILGLALDSGFNSKSSFNRVFKELEGITPSVFIKTNRSQISY